MKVAERHFYMFLKGKKKKFFFNFFKKENHPGSRRGDTFRKGKVKRQRDKTPK